MSKITTTISLRMLGFLTCRQTRFQGGAATLAFKGGGGGSAPILIHVFLPEKNRILLENISLSFS